MTISRRSLLSLPLAGALATGQAMAQSAPPPVLGATRALSILV